jgi:hypothetical protein
VPRPGASLKDRAARAARPVGVVLGTMVALWPLTAVLLACIGFILAIGLNAGP